MTIDAFRDYCLSLPAVTEGFPFGENTLVFKVAGKMFALTDITNFKSINLKCDPETAIELRERYEAVQPGYHMSKTHWNTVLINGSIPQKELRQWIKDSYDLVFASLPKSVRTNISI